MNGTQTNPQTVRTTRIDLTHSWCCIFAARFILHKANCVPKSPNESTRYFRVWSSDRCTNRPRCHVFVSGMWILSAGRIVFYKHFPIISWKRCPNSLKAFWAHFFVSTVKPFHLQFRTNLLHYITYWERFSVWVSLHPTALKFLSPCLSIFTTAGVFGVRRWPSALSHSIVQSSAGPLTVGGEVNSSFMSAFFLNDTKSWGITQDGYVCTNCLSFVPLSLFSCFQLLSWEVINQNHPLRQIDRQ